MSQEAEAKPFPLTHVNFVLNAGGIGDHICRIPALYYILKNYPHVVPHVWVQDHFKELAEHFLKPVLNKRLFVKDFSRFTPERPETRFPSADMDSDTHTSLSTHLVDHAFRCLVDKDGDSPEAFNYPRLDLKNINLSFELPERYAVITTGFTAANREFPAPEINKVIEFLRSKNVLPVFLGKAQNSYAPGSTVQTNFSEGVNYDLGLNLVDKTSLLEAGKIMAYAKVVIGVDGGLIHLAACSDVPIVVGYTSASAKTRLPIRGGVIGKDIQFIQPEGCNGCESKMHFVYEHDFRTCYYNTFSCVKEMTADKFLAAIEKGGFLA